MKKSPKTLPLLVTAGVLLLAAAVGITCAYMFKKAERNNAFEPAVVTCVVHEKLDGAEPTVSAPVGREKSDIRVENTGNIDAYLRIRLLSYWVSEKGEIIGLSSELPEITLDTAHWIAGADGTYYYQTPVKPGAQTEALCEPFTLREKADADGETVRQVVEIFAEAVQANPVEAVTDAWGVTIENGRIIP